MSKRYGRNQKARHRAMIEKLETIIEQKDNSLSSTKNKHAYLLTQFHDMVKIINRIQKNSSILPPENEDALFLVMIDLIVYSFELARKVFLALLMMYQP